MPSNREDTHRPLPSKRRGYTQELYIGGIKMFLRTGEYEDGRLGEIFLTFAKQGTVMRGMADAFAISMSLGLQQGVPLEKYVETFIRTKFPPEGVVIGHPYIKMGTSFADVVVRDLAINYLGRVDLANIQLELGHTLADLGNEPHDSVPVPVPIPNADLSLRGDTFPTLSVTKERIADMTSKGKF